MPKIVTKSHKNITKFVTFAKGAGAVVAVLLLMAFAVKYWFNRINHPTPSLPSEQATVTDNKAVLGNASDSKSHNASKKVAKPGKQEAGDRQGVANQRTPLPSHLSRSLPRQAELEKIPKHRRAEVLFGAVAEFNHALDDLEFVRTDTAGIKPLVEQAGQALGQHHLERGKNLLRQAEELELAASKEAGARRVAVVINATQLNTTRARVLLSELKYQEAAGLFLDAAQYAEPVDKDTHLMLLTNAALTLVQHGDVFGENSSLSRAVDVWREIQEKTSRTEKPQAWAKNQHDLATTLKMLGKREPGKERLLESVAALQGAMTVFTRKKVPRRWARAQSSMGETYLLLAERTSGTEHLEMAVKAFSEALKVINREKSVRFWAENQNGLGQALTRLGHRRSDKASLERAVLCLRAVLKVRTRKHDAKAWALTQFNLGRALGYLGELELGSTRLEEAVKAFQATLEVFTRRANPDRWATTQNNLGNALHKLGSRGKDGRLLQEAVDAYRAAITEHNRENAPFSWAKTQNNLGNVFCALAEQQNDKAYLEEAVKAYRAALEVKSREKNPISWGLTQNNLGKALGLLGRQEDDIKLLKDSLQAHYAAIKVFHAAGAEKYMRSAVVSGGDIQEELEKRGVFGTMSQ